MRCLIFDARELSKMTQANLTLDSTDRYNRDMGRTSSKKTIERRKKPRRKAPSKASKAAKGAKDADPETFEAMRLPEPVTTLTAEFCRQCDRGLAKDDRALFVEEEIGRIFCSEACISAYFAPEVERLEKEYLKLLSARDLSGEEREKLAHLRWITLQEPDEVWRQKTLAGDYRYTLISEFKPGNKPIWCVSICLFLRGEPSFLYIAFPTRNEAMVNHYRRGERVAYERPPQQASEGSPVGEMAEPEAAPVIDGLAADWTAEETIRAQSSNFSRAKGDIPPSEFMEYQSCLEETLQAPDEIWVQEVNESDGSLQVFRFLKEYREGGFWYVIMARETDGQDEIEIVDAFPTRDAELVQRQRIGAQEGAADLETANSSRLVH